MAAATMTARAIRSVRSERGRAGQPSGRAGGAPSSLRSLRVRLFFPRTCLHPHGAGTGGRGPKRADSLHLLPFRVDRPAH